VAGGAMILEKYAHSVPEVKSTRNTGFKKRGQRRPAVNEMEPTA